MSKIVIPDGMLDASLEALRQAWGYSKELSWEVKQSHRANTRIAVEAALLWLSQNPIAPSFVQVSAFGKWVEGKEDYIISSITKWQGKMFMAPEPELDPLVMYIIRHFETLDSDKAAVRNRAEAAIEDYQEHIKRNSPKLEDLLIPIRNLDEAHSHVPKTSIEYNRAVVEAYNRGKQRKDDKS